MSENYLKELINKFRNGAKASDDKRDSGLNPNDPDVERIDNLQYGPDKQWHSLDVYLPKHIEPPFPTIINVHGGGWVYGTKETYQYYGMGMAKRGFAFINPNYRLAPEDAEYPDELNDVNAYIQWVDQHAEEYRLDRKNVFLIGDSAGGQMVEQYATILSNPDYAKKFSFKAINLKIRAIGLNCSAAFVLNDLNSLEAAYFTKNVVEKYHEQLNVEKYINQNFPPTFLITGNEDFLRDVDHTLFGFLLGRGVEADLRMYGDQQHPCYHVFFVDQKSKIAAKATDDELEFFRHFEEK